MKSTRPKGLAWLATLAACTLVALSVFQPRARGQDAAPSEPSAPAVHPGPGGAIPTAPQASRREVDLRSRADRGAVFRRGAREVYVELDLETPELTREGAQPPSDIVVVADVSGSMSGTKLAFAKHAIAELSEKLDDRDRLALVDYADEARLRLPLTQATARARRSFAALASSLETRGSTNLSGGLDLGFDVVEMGRRPARVSRVLLLSDGLANRGDTSRAGLRRRGRRAALGGYSLSTLGIGGDFDEGVMTDLAQAGAGAFYYLNRLDALAAFFEAELENARQTYAQSGALELRPAPGVEIESVMGLPLERRGDRVTVYLGSLYAGQTRRLWVRLRVPESGSRAQALGRAVLSYARAGAASSRVTRELPVVQRVESAAAERAAIELDVWERVVVEEELNAAQERLGEAVRSGSERELERAVEQQRRRRDLALELGSTRVVEAIDDFERDAAQARAEQKAPAVERMRAAKKRKAIGHGKRNASAYPNTAFDLGI